MFRRAEYRRVGGLLAGILILAAHGLPVRAADGPSGKQGPILACASEDQWAPYDYVDPHGPNTVVGATVDTVRELMRRRGRAVRVDRLPWVRCQELVRNGSYHMLLDASPNPQRYVEYFVSAPLYRLVQALYYIRGEPPIPPSLAAIAARPDLRVCGVFGYNLDVFGLPAAQIDQSAKDPQGALQMLRAHRCAFLIGYLAPWDAAARVGELDLRGTDRAVVPEIPTLTYHVLATRRGPDAALLASALGAGVEEMRADGALGKIFARHGAEAIDVPIRSKDTIVPARPGPMPQPGKPSERAKQSLEKTSSQPLAATSRDPR